MGLLDDAIREHLELKRQHGGDPGEIDRQEAEAFGADARREDDEPEAVADPGATEPEPVAPDPGTATEEHEPPAAQPGPEDFAADAPTTAYTPAELEDATGDADEVEPPAGEEEVPSAGHEADAPGYDEDPWLDEVTEEERPAAESAEAEEDVLEETPDFLQETPEHDRLWFEQKPPRDFDWDR